MNKYTKNQIFFNLEKIIALTTVVTVTILTISLHNSQETVLLEGSASNVKLVGNV